MMRHNHFIYKIWDIFKPFVIYYVLHSVVFILLISLCQIVVQRLDEAYRMVLTGHSETVTQLVSGVSMILAVLPLIPMLRVELAEHASSSAEMPDRIGGVRAVCLTILLAVTASLGLNSLLALTGMVGASSGYQDVARQQYSVLFGVGMILFGLISPVTEEVVFRGLIFNRLRRWCPHMAAVILSGILFGLYHGNLVQGLYGGCMGILMAYLYERMHSFLTPCLFHAAANLIVYTASQNGVLQGKIFTLSGCVILLSATAGILCLIEKVWNR